MIQTLARTVIRSTENADRLMTQIRSSAGRLDKQVAVQADPLEMLQRIKFDQIGNHPLDGRPVSMAEQIDETWTYAVAVAAARQLLLLHPQADGFQLTPGRERSPRRRRHQRERWLGARRDIRRGHAA